ncbi:hypothetical protein [Catenuloplanes atrovinosus]|uniref:Uncharacterized protein n=1 Tax=Catenuloplanes atrovinosus TaxID=137266 RepID=A0AAE3YK94_9ACTN|nr:hypothetical protein [Catenuloplanes atrovinosus]MDR7274985.1 hypothetical protein [Catenuloplanes atrovinosus]
MRRRAVLTGGVAAGTVLAGAGTARAASPEDGFRVVDRRGRQRMLAATTKPPIIHGGRIYPAELRQGPADGTYLIFNDEDGTEKGGITASAAGASVSLDYPNAQAITLATTWEGALGASVLVMNQMPDPALPLTRTPPAVPRVQLGWSAMDGAFLALTDSAGRPRILLEVGPDDTPRIRVLNADGSEAA